MSLKEVKPLGYYIPSAFVRQLASVVEETIVTVICQGEGENCVLLLEEKTGVGISLITIK